MADSVYRVTELVGTSSQSWEAAAKGAIETASKTLRDLRVAEVVRQDLTIENGKIPSYRGRLNGSFKYEGTASTTKGRRYLPVRGRPGSGRPPLCLVGSGS